MLPWYAHKNRRTQNVPIVFGHWATLNGNVSLPDVFALDTGCAWGNTLTAMRLSDKQRFSCGCAG
jgi:bis(5'-nucleosyl)-tetraphosphatase (symmetrical)